MLGPTGWIPVDGSTLETQFPSVYAIGDVIAIRLRNGMFLPKAGVFAEAQGSVVAERISAELRGEESSATFGGQGHCYLEVGDGLAALAMGNFYASPSPDVKLGPPSARYRIEKEQFESSRLQRWLG